LISPTTESPGCCTTLTKSHFAESEPFAIVYFLADLQVRSKYLFLRQLFDANFVELCKFNDDNLILF
jgi:hypothetical protein